MPQVTCPNCGMTINLENRKEIDVNLIKDAAKKSPRTFTELLRVTKLPRKTLSLRLKELCSNGTIVKSDGMYRLNGVSGFGNNSTRFSMKLSRARVLTLITLLVFSTTSGYVLAKFFTTPQYAETRQEPIILGNFTMALSINNVKDLDTWQAVIVFNSSELRVLEVVPGDFLRCEYPFFVNATDVGDGVLLLGGTLSGDVAGKDGSGELATIKFGYFTDDYTTPEIAMHLGEGFLETALLDSAGARIDLNGSTILMLK